MVSYSWHTADTHHDVLVHYPSYCCDTPYSRHERFHPSVCQRPLRFRRPRSTHVRGDAIKAPTRFPPFRHTSRSLIYSLLGNDTFSSIHCTHNTLYHCSLFIVPNLHRHAPIIRQMPSMSERSSLKIPTSISVLTLILTPLVPPPSWSLNLSSRLRQMWVYYPK